MSTLPEFLDGYSVQPATKDEAMDAFHKGQMMGADFVILARELDDDGDVDEQMLFVMLPAEAPLRATFEKMAQEGLAIRCTATPTRQERRKAGKA